MQFNNMLAILIILGALPLATGLQCYSCVHMKSNIPVLSELMQPYPACRNGTTQMTSKECGTGSACVTGKGELSYNTLFTIEATVRVCLDENILAVAGLDSLSNQCKSVNEGAEFSGFTVKEGSVCVCTTDNCNGEPKPAPVNGQPMPAPTNGQPMPGPTNGQPMPGLKCYSCVHMKSTNIPALSELIQPYPACRDDTTQMTSKECGTGSACVTGKGEVSVKAFWTGYSIEATVRVCLDENILAVVGLNSLSNQCNEGVDLSILGGFTVKGSVCVCTTDNCNGEPKPAPVNGQPMSAPTTGQPIPTPTNGQAMSAQAIFTFFISLVMVIFVSF